MEDREVCHMFSQTRTFVGVNLDVKRGKVKLSKVVQPRVDVSAVEKKSGLKAVQWLL